MLIYSTISFIGLWFDVEKKTITTALKVMSPIAGCGLM